MNYKNLCVVIGCSNLGSTIANELSNNGENVLIIDKDSNSFDKIPESYGGNTVLGDATDINVLNDNGIKDSKLVVIATDNENINIFLAHLISKLYNAKLVIVRLNTIDKKGLIEGIPNIRAIYPFTLSVEFFDKILKENI
jgi:trk system potassium uptake protein TrkA